MTALLTERLSIRVASEEDASAYADAALESREEVAAWSRRDGAGRSREDFEKKARDRVVAMAAGSVLHFYAFTREQPERFVGGVTIHPWRDPRDPSSVQGSPARVDETKDLEVGTWCRTTMVGNGYASEAVRAVIEHAFRDLGARAIWVRLAETNGRSRRAAERGGFVLVERLSYPASPEWGDAATVLIMRLER